MNGFNETTDENESRKSQADAMEVAYNLQDVLCDSLEFCLNNLEGEFDRLIRESAIILIDPQYANIQSRFEALFSGYRNLINSDEDQSRKAKTEPNFYLGKLKKSLGVIDEKLSKIHTEKPESDLSKYMSQILRGVQHTYINYGIITLDQINERKRIINKRVQDKLVENPEYHAELARRASERFKYEPEEQVIEYIRTELNKKADINTIATELGIAPLTVTHIIEDNEIKFEGLETSTAKQRAKWKLVRNSENTAKIFSLIDEGNTSSEIAEKLGVTYPIVRYYLKDIKVKFDDSDEERAYYELMINRLKKNNAVQMNANLSEAHERIIKVENTEVREAFLKELATSTNTQLRTKYGVSKKVIHETINRIHSMGVTLPKRHFQNRIAIEIKLYGDKPENYETMMKLYDIADKKTKGKLKRQLLNDWQIHVSTFDRLIFDWREKNNKPTE